MKVRFPAIALFALLAGCHDSAQNVGAKIDAAADNFTVDADAVGNAIDHASGAAGKAVNALDSAAANMVDAIDRPTDAWVGHWVGVEGLVLDIAKADAPGSYRLHIALLDGPEDHRGRADGAVIRFTRAGKEEVIRHTDGQATGLKYLAGKTDCLTIKAGEGFCRD